jgi:hypothetical protein
MNHDEGEDRVEWNRAWRERPLRRLVNLPQINVAPAADQTWGKVARFQGTRRINPKMSRQRKKRLKINFHRA